MELPTWPGTLSIAGKYEKNSVRVAVITDKILYSMFEAELGPQVDFKFGAQCLCI